MGGSSIAPVVPLLLLLLQVFMEFSPLWSSMSPTAMLHATASRTALIADSDSNSGSNSVSSCPAFTSALAFGDSTTDTGNDIINNPVVFNNSAHFPYGQTFFHKSTGRYSDGRLMVDYLMMALGQPLLEPSLSLEPQPSNNNKSSSSSSSSSPSSSSLLAQSNVSSSTAQSNVSSSTHSAAQSNVSSTTHTTAAQRSHQNFAFSGATALDEATLVALAGPQLRRAIFTTINLAEELRWFESAAREQAIDLRRSVVYFGEIGGNDYNYAIGSGDNASTVVPRLIGPVIARLNATINHLLGRGVRHLIVQGQFPQGCLSLYLTLFRGAAAPTDYDSLGCIVAVNRISARHNQLLRQVVENASKAYPEAEIVFLDTYGAYTHLLANAASYNITNTSDACDTRDASRFSGAAAALLAPRTGAVAETCENPENYLSWDSIHMTDAAYGILSRLFLTDARFSSHYPNFLSQCATSNNGTTSS